MIEPATSLPVAVIGAGPVGLAAAAQLVERGLTPLVFERGDGAGAAMRDWAHVRVFSPWCFNIDDAARRLLERHGWTAPDTDALPTGGEIVSLYLEPLAALPELAGAMRFGAEVIAITRDGLDKMTSQRRDALPFAIRWRDGAGALHVTKVRAVIDASGTWKRPNPIGIDGLEVPGEAEHAGRIAYGMPDVLGAARADYAGKRVLIIGGGHSAIQSALGLLELQRQAPETHISWGLRRNRIERLLGGGLNDQLPARGELGLAARRAIEEERLDLLAPFAVQAIDSAGDGLAVTATLNGHEINLEVDRIIVATGFRPDLDMLRELRVSLDPAVEAPPALAPLIDPNLHSCGTVPPHGIEELSHPEKDFVIVGAKSYGRAPTFLMATGYEQVRSVAAELAGDHAAARQVQLVLPETGVCSTGNLVAADAAEGCCGGPAKSEESCCVADETAKAEGADGCGCGSTAAPAEVTVRVPAEA